MGVSGATSLWHRHCSPPRMFTQFLHGKVLLGQLASHLCSFSEHSKTHTIPSIPHDVHLDRVLPFQLDEFSQIHKTEFLLLTRLNTICSQCNSAADGQVFVLCQKLTSYPLYFGGKMSLCSQLVSQVLGGQPIPAIDGRSGVAIV